MKQCTLQVQGRDGYPVIYSGSRDCTKRMYQAEGLRAFWRGSLTSFLKVVRQHRVAVIGILNYKAVCMLHSTSFLPGLKIYTGSGIGILQRA